MLGPVIGSKLILLDETDSTNSHASRLLHNSFPEEGTVIMAQFQKAGRGQRGTGWESAKGENLTVSYILFPEFVQAGNHFLLNQAISLAVAHAVSEITAEKAYIKWPNDIIIGKGKIAGVLIENTLRNGRVNQSIAGIGININQIEFNDYYPAAISIRHITGQETDPANCLKVLSSQMNKWYTALKLGQIEKIRKSYAELIFRKDQRSDFETAEGRFSATITGVTEDGRLMINAETMGDQQYFNIKEIRLMTY